MLLLVSLSLAAPPALNLLPFGVGVYAHDRPVRGVIYTVTQIVGFSVLTYGSIRTDQAMGDGDETEYYRWEGVSALGATAGFGSWIVSAVDGGRLHELEAAEKAARLREWDAQLLVARGEFDD